MLTDTIKQTLEDAHQAALLEKFEEVSSQLQDIDFPRLVRFLTNVTQFDSEFWETDENRKALELAIRITQEMYNNSTIPSPISDEEFDMLHAVYESVTARSIVGATVGNRSTKVVSAHKYPDLRGTLDKIHFITNDEKSPNEARKSLEDWLKSISKLYGRPLVEVERNVLLTPKWDGVSAVFECGPDGAAQRVLKRGDTTRNEAEEMTDLFCPDTDFKSFEFYQDRLWEGDFAVKVEIVMSDAQFQEFRKLFPDIKTPRSAVSSIINSHDTDKRWLKYLTIIPIRVQVAETEDQFIPSDVNTLYPTYFVKNVYDPVEVRDKIDKIQYDVHNEFGIAIDGVVLSLTHPDTYVKLGRRENINKYEVAYKLPGEQAVTTLLDVIFSIGDSGAITPVAVFETVQMKGVSVTNASLGSIGRFNRLQLSKGDIVRVLYDIIPYLECDNPSHSAIIQAPTHCPTCDAPLVNDPVLRCNNNECLSRKVGRLVKYITKMDIADIGEETIRRFVNEGILKDIPDLYTLDRKGVQIMALPGFGEKSYKKMLDNIRKRSIGVDPAVFFGALGIISIGRRMWTKVFENYSYSQILDWSYDEPEKALTKLVALPGFQTTTANRIIDGLAYNRGTIDTLLTNEHVKFSMPTVEAKLTDENTEFIVFTKVRDKLFEQFLEQQNVVIQGDIRKDTTLLIVPSTDETSSKVKKAVKNNIPIMTLTEAYAHFMYSPE